MFLSITGCNPCLTEFCGKKQGLMAAAGPEVGFRIEIIDFGIFWRWLNSIFICWGLVLAFGHCCPFQPHPPSRPLLTALPPTTLSSGLHPTHLVPLAHQVRLQELVDFAQANVEAHEETEDEAGLFGCVEESSMGEEGG